MTKPAAEQAADKVTPLRLTDEQKIAVMRFDSPYQVKARAIMKASEDEVGIYLASDSVPNDLAIRIAWGLAEAELNAVEAMGKVIEQLAISTFPFGTKCWCRAVDACEDQKQCVAARAALAQVERLKGEG